MNINNWLRDHPTGSEYGAAIGDRGDRGDPDRAYKFYLQHIDLDEGAYDRAYTYWGLPRNLWGFMCFDDEDGRVRGFVRASNRAMAKAAVLDEYPNARFYR